MKISKVLALSIFISFNFMVNTDLSAQNKKAKSSKNKPVSSSLSTYEKYIDDNNDAHLKNFRAITLYASIISSIPTYKPDVQRAAEWIVNKLKSIGISNAQVMPTGGQPAVFGSWKRRQEFNNPFGIPSKDWAQSTEQYQIYLWAERLVARVDQATSGPRRRLY